MTDNTWFHISRELASNIQGAAKQVGLGHSFAAEMRLADPKFGDFQSNGVLPYAKKNGLRPRDTALLLVDALKTQEPFSSELISMSVAGPGFINFKLSAEYLFKWMMQYTSEEDFKQAASVLHQGKTIVIDYSSPNTAKQMHVGHLRSMVIGEAIQRMLSFCGAKMIKDNHLGDWGTQFGILIMAIKREGYDLDNPEGDVLEELERIYKKGHQLTKDDPTALDEARAELVKLQDGDTQNMQLWKKISEVSYEAFESIYDKFNVSFDAVLGESFYRDKAERVFNELQETKIAQEDDGALVVFHPDHPRFAKQPFIIRKSDGATNYGTTDLATALYRLEHFKADEVINVTDGRQQDHFEQLGLTVDKWFEKKGYRPLPMKHVWFGTILGEDGKAIKTRSGDPIKLKDLVQESIDRAYTIVDKKSPELEEEEKQDIANKVGIGAIRYSDLSQNRTMDYTFSWEKLLSFDGNTAPYMMYAVARIYSIFRKAGVKPGEAEEQASSFASEAECTLARKLIGFPVALDLSLSDLRSHHLCQYLFELSGAFSSFYSAEKVIVDNEQDKARRLMLCARTLKVLETGLHLMGIETLERM